MRIDTLRQRARRSIGVDRGYIAESVAAEWAISHSHSISSLVNDGNARRDELGDQLASLLFNTICIADQYNVDLRLYYDSRSLEQDITLNKKSNDSPVPDICHRLIAHTSRMIATLAFYHGWNHDRTLLPLGDHISDIHQILFALAAQHKIVLDQYIEKVAIRARGVDSRLSPLVDVYHPSNSRVLAEFSPIKADSVCTFARAAVAWGARPYNEGTTLSNNLHSNMGTFARFARATIYEDIDSMLFQFPPRFGISIEILSKLLNSVLRYYSRHDPKNDFSVAQVERADWRFHFNGMPMFVQTFAPCYGADNSRFSFNTEKTFIQFVSEKAFHRKTARDPDKWQKARDIIRKRAEEMSQPYDVRDHEALTFVHPMRAGEAPVRWQDMGILDDE